MITMKQFVSLTVVAMETKKRFFSVITGTVAKIKMPHQKHEYSRYILPMKTVSLLDKKCYYLKNVQILRKQAHGWVWGVNICFFDPSRLATTRFSESFKIKTQVSNELKYWFKEILYDEN